MKSRRRSASLRSPKRQRGSRLSSALAPGLGICHVKARFLVDFLVRLLCDVLTWLRTCLRAYLYLSQQGPGCKRVHARGKPSFPVAAASRTLSAAKA